MREFCLVGVGFLSTMGGDFVRGILSAGFLSVSHNISLYTKIMMVNISTIYTIFKLRLFPTIHCKWHQMLVKLQKLLGGGGGGGETYPPPPHS